MFHITHFTLHCSSTGGEVIIQSMYEGISITSLRAILTLIDNESRLETQGSMLYTTSLSMRREED